MPPPPAALAAARTAVAADPGSLSLRLHLASLLLDVGAADEALPELEKVLEGDGANVEALLQASRACEALGETSRAARYHDMATRLSLGAGPAAEGAAEPTVRAGGARLTLADIGGLDHVKQRLTVMFLAPLRKPEIRDALHASSHRGLLMFGPPGCGKTLLARALAGELVAHFIPVGAGELVTASEGSNLDVREIFRLARENHPAVLFFDALETLGRAPAVVERMVAEMAVDANDGVFMLAASERPWDVPPALLGPGAFGTHLVILPPDRTARVAILRHHLAGREARNLNLDGVAGQLDGYSGADIAQVCWAAVTLAEGTSRPVITREHLEEAISQVPRTTPGWFVGARNASVLSSEGGMYDDLVVYMRSRRMV